MAHNFRWHLQNNISTAQCLFVNKAGNEANSGGLDDPKKSLLQPGLGVGYLVAGSGDYLAEGSFTNYKIVADGIVQIRTNNLGLYKNYGGPTEPELRGVRVVVGTSLSCTGTDNEVIYFRGGCFIKAQDINAGAQLITGNGSIPFAEDTTLKGMQTAGSGQPFRFNYMNLIGCRLSQQYIKNSYVDAASVITVIDPTQCSNNNIQGQISVGGTLFSSLADAKDFNSSWFPGCISAAPRFNKVESEDFSLKRESPHLNAGIGPRTLRLATGFVLETEASAGQDVTIANTRLRSLANPAYTVSLLQTYGFIANDQGGLSVKPNSAGDAEGFILFDKLRVADVPVEINYFNLIAGLNFDSDFLADTANPNPYNNNVPDYTKPVAGTAGNSPNRLTQQFRWSRGTLPDVTAAADWQSGASFVEFEIGSAPRYNTTPLRGNGDAAYDVTAANEAPVARWIQARVKARNN